MTTKHSTDDEWVQHAELIGPLAHAQEGAALSPPDVLYDISARGYGPRAVERAVIHVLLTREDGRRVHVTSVPAATAGVRVVPLAIGPFERLHVRVEFASPLVLISRQRWWGWLRGIADALAAAWGDGTQPPHITVCLRGVRRAAAPSAINA